MRLKTVMQCGIALALAAATGGCYEPHSYTGPGCLIKIYGLPGARGYALPIRGDTEELAEPWSKWAVSAKVIYGSWRLYSEPEFVASMGDYRAPTEIVKMTPAHHLGSLECVAPAPEPPRYWW